VTYVRVPPRWLLLVVAGNETTRHTITHSMLALLQHPEQLARLQEDPSLIPVAVEEFLRWASPVYHLRRTATRDVELGGKRIREGDKVVLVWPGRDHESVSAAGGLRDRSPSRRRHPEGVRPRGGEPMPRAAPVARDVGAALADGGESYALISCWSVGWMTVKSRVSKRATRVRSRPVDQGQLKLLRPLASR
jgi:hypothetical protein